jgi:hypothetical protein
MLLHLVIGLASAVVASAGSCHFKLELTWGKGSPDGFERDMIFINGQYPGPVLDIQQDDWVEIDVVNNLPFNTSIHAHGSPHDSSRQKLKLTLYRHPPD